jgi:hypothetical protein
MPYFKMAENMLCPCSVFSPADPKILSECKEACRDTKTSIRLASHLVRAPDSRCGGHEFESPLQRELGALNKSRKTTRGH